MGQTSFYSDLDDLCLEWATPIPGNPTKYGGPIRTGSEKFRIQFRRHREAIFEQLLLFEKINFSIRGPNVIAPILYKAMGARAFEQLIDEDVINFVVWTPGPMLSLGDGKIKATLVGRFGDGYGSELDIEKIVDTGLRIQQVNMPDGYRAAIRNKLIARHTLLDENLPSTAWIASEKALREGALEKFGLQRRDGIVGLESSSAKLIQDVADSITEYRYILQQGYVSKNQKYIFDLFQSGCQNLEAAKSPMEKYTVVAEYEKFPNLSSIYGELEKPFDVASRYRNTHTARKFRDWISDSADTTSTVDIIREYVNECSKRKGLFESKPAKFVKLTAMVAIGQFVSPETHLLGGAAGAILSGVPAPMIDKILDTTADFGLGVVETFMIDNLKVGWTPRAYFDGLRRLQRQVERKRLS